MSKSDVFAWLLTYLLHGTLLLGLAWLVSRSRLGRSSASLSEALWRFALFAPPLTALLQVAVGGEPLAGRLALGAPAPARFMKNFMNQPLIPLPCSLRGAGALS